MHVEKGIQSLRSSQQVCWPALGIKSACVPSLLPARRRPPMLDVFQNGLKQLPPAIANATSLRRLCIEWNGLTELPAGAYLAGVLAACTALTRAAQQASSQSSGLFRCSAALAMICTSAGCALCVPARVERHAHVHKLGCLLPPCLPAC